MTIGMLQIHGSLEMTMSGIRKLATIFFISEKQSSHSLPSSRRRAKISYCASGKRSGLLTLSGVAQQSKRAIDTPREEIIQSQGAR